MAGYGSCGICNVNCKTCYGPTETNCLSCYPGVGYFQGKCKTCTVMPSYFSTTTGICVTCASTQFGFFEAQKCENCHSSCETCRNSTIYNCSSCIDQAYLAKLTSACISCLSNQWGHDATEKCYNCHPICTKCNANATAESHMCTECKPYVEYLATIRTCISCAVGTYGNVTSQNCDPCHPSCISCRGGLKTDCMSCDLYLYAYYDVEHRCLPALQPGYVNFVTLEFQSCPAGKFGDSIQQKCIDCPHPCTVCFGTNIAK